MKLFSRWVLLSLAAVLGGSVADADGPEALHVVLREALPAAALHNASHGLRVSDNRRYLVDAQTGAPVFLLADTAWNLGALKLDEVETYLRSREEHGFTAVMFALNFAPQADETNAYGEPAYLGENKTQHNPAYYEFCDAFRCALTACTCIKMRRG